MRRYILPIFTLCMTMAVKATGQEIIFISQAIEDAVRQHIGIGDDECVNFEQTDTITTLDLSRRGITDIRDLIILPNLQSVDLSDNKIEDLHPLTVLDSLKWVDLSYNNLKSINDLFYSKAKSLTVCVYFNNIKDFSLFASVTSRNFRLEGAGLQMSEDAPYFDVYQFYADIDTDGIPLVRYRGYTNIEAEAYVECGAICESALIDGDTHETKLDGIVETTIACVTNGEHGDTTYVVPVFSNIMAANESFTIETGLPEDYTIRGFAPTQYGTMQIEGVNLTYTATNGVEYEEYVYAYYEGTTLKGFSKVILGSSTITGIGDVTTEDNLLVVSTIGKGSIVVSCHSRLLQLHSVLRIYNAAGALLHEERLDTHNGLSKEISLGVSTSGIVIVQLESGKRVLTGKIVM